MYGIQFDRVSGDPNNSILPPVHEDENWEKEAEKDGDLNAIADYTQDIMTKYT